MTMNFANCRPKTTPLYQHCMIANAFNTLKRNAEGFIAYLISLLFFTINKVEEPNSTE